MKVLLTGGSGLLGRHLKMEAERPSHEQFDIVEGGFWKAFSEYDLIVHCAAYTDVQKAETDRLDCFYTNVLGTLNLLLAYPDTPMVYISSEYAYKPVNFYSLTKKMAEDLVLDRGNCLIIRTLFKESPWKYEYAFEDAWTEGDTVEIIAPLVEKEIMEWSRKGKKIVYVGTGRKRIIDIARKTKPDVIPNKTTDIKDVVIPKDYK